MEYQLGYILCVNPLVSSNMGGKFIKCLYGDGSKAWYLVNPKIAGKWMFIPLKMVLIGIYPYPYLFS